MSRLRSILDVTTTVAILATCGVLLYSNWPNRRGPGPPQALPEAPIAIDGATLRGDVAARVVLIEWSDYQCPYCARAERDIIATLDEKYVKTNRVLFAFRHNPLAKIHPQAAKAAEAALCAGQQQRFWEMHAGLFQDSKRLAQSDLMKRAAELKRTQFGPARSQAACRGGASVP